MEDDKPFQIYGLLHPGLKKEGFFKSRKLKDSRFYAYKMHDVLFEKPVKNDKLAENENKSIDSFLGLDEKLPQTISFLHYNEIAPFGYEYSFIPDLQEKESRVFMLQGCYVLNIRDKDDFQRYNREYGEWQIKNERWEEKVAITDFWNKETREAGKGNKYVTRGKKPELPNEAWSIDLLTLRTPGQLQEIFSSNGLISHFYIQSKNFCNDKMMLEAGDLKEFDLHSNRPTLKKGRLKQKIISSLYELVK